MYPAFLLLISAMLIAHTASGAEEQAAGHSAKPPPGMKIQIKAGEKTIIATMRDTETARDFLSLLPLQLNLKDYAGTEKISDLPKRLSTQGAPQGHDPDVGDITYYAPWGNLAIFYKDFGYSDGLILVGKIDGDMAALTTPDTPKVTIELIQ